MDKGSILFISTLNLATNPRLVKELRLAISSGYRVYAVLFEFDNWSKLINDQLTKELSRDVIIFTIKASRKPFLPWLVSTLSEKFFETLSCYTKYFHIHGLADKRSLLLLYYLRNLKAERFNFIVAHNSGAIYPAWHAAQKLGVPYCFDAEDYHPGEANRPVVMRRMKLLFKTLLAQAAYISSASPQILRYVLNDIGKYSGLTTVVQNYFPLDDFQLPLPSSENDKLRLVWFSQNIDKGRGLESIVTIMQSFRDSVELHCIGNKNQVFFDSYLREHPNVICHGPVMQTLLHRKLAEFDIGLAIEPSRDLNNTLAVSNKIISYMQAGLYIIATETEGQVCFLSQFPGIGTIVDIKDTESLMVCIQKCLNDKIELRNNMRLRYEKAKIHCWETESKKLTEVWDKISIEGQY